jgi:RNA polymerase sigma-70 factor, ECF subfamily
MIFEEIYKAYWNKVFRVCMGFVNDADQAKDIAQETFISVFKNLSGFRNESGIATWIFRIATNHCLRQIEKDKKTRKVDLPENIIAAETYRENENLALLYRFISEMPEADRILISLELEDVKQAEIAEIIGISDANVRVKIYRIKEKLKQKFAEHGQRN